MNFIEELINSLIMRLGRRMYSPSQGDGKYWLEIEVTLSHFN